MPLIVVRTSGPGFAYASSRVQPITTPTVGNSLIAVIEHQATGTLSVTDTAGNTWTRRLGSENATPTAATGQFKIDIWDCLGITTGKAPTSVTVTNTATSTLAITVYEVSGSISFGSAASGSIPTTAGGTSPQPSISCSIGDLIISGLSYYASSNVATVASPYSLVVGSGTSTTRYDSAYLVTTVSGVTNAYFTTTGSSFTAGAVTARYVPVSSNIPPVANFTTSTTMLTASVDGTASFDPDGTVVSYDYDWGDGSPHGTSVTASHTYPAVGTYTITLIVTDNGAATGTYSMTVITTTNKSAPTRKGHIYNPGPGTGNTSIVLDPSVPTSGSAVSIGDWMVAVITTVTSVITAAPSGWTTLQALTQAGTLGTSIFAKIRATGETSYNFTMDVGASTSSADLFWGSNADSVANWIMGTNGLRSATGTSTTNVAPSINSIADNSLGILISTERTTTNETAVTSLSGVTEWFFDAQANTSTLIQSIEVAYLAIKTPTGALGGVTVTYPNPQSTNGMAQWIVIPPAASTTTTTIRATSTYTGNAFNHTIPLPIGSAVGDWIILAIADDSQLKTLTLPGTSLYNAIVGTTNIGISKKQLDSNDIKNGYLTVAISGPAYASAVIVGYSTSGGFDPLGTVTVRASSSTDTTALATTSNGTQDILVLSFEKSNATGGVTGVTPTTTQLANAIQNSVLRPSVYVGKYTGTGVTRTVTQPVASSNGMAVQIGVTPGVVGNILPIASFTTNTNGLALSVDGSASVDPDGTIVIYDWNWGDATSNGSGAITNHTYASAGTFNCILTVTDNLGGTGVASKFITVPAPLAPTMKGHAYDNISSNYAGLVIGPDGSISTGDWMVAVFTTGGTTTITPATGWTTLLGLTVAGSGKIAVFGKIRVSGDTSYMFPVSNSASTSAITLMWGADAGALSSWITGSTGIRASSIATNTAPAVTTSTNNSLVLTISMDRCTSASTAITNVTGATDWFFTPGTAAVLQTVEVASSVMATPGPTSSVVVTYPVASANGIALQIVLPSAAPPSPFPPAAPIRFVSDFTTTTLRVGAKIEDATTVRLVATPHLGGTAIISPIQIPSYFGWVNCKVSGLTPGTAYDLSLQAGSSNIEVATFTAIKTLDPTVTAFSVVTSSCQSTGSNPIVFAQMALENPDFFAHQGDIHYEDTDVENVWRTGVDAAISASYMKAMLATVPMTYHWDNHDWGGNSSYKTSPVATFAPTAVRELLGNDMPDTVGLYSTWAHHGIRFVETDQWALRDDATITDGPSKSMLGATQKAWFKATLLAAKEPIIIWFCSFPFYSNDIGNGRWGDFQTEQNELNAWFIARPGIKARIVAVGGDSHSICADDGTNSMWHIPSLNASPLQNAGGLASGTWNIANINVDDTKGYFSKLIFTPTPTKIGFTWQAKQDDGTIMATWSKTFSRTIVNIWDGTVEHSAKVTLWNGTSEVPITIELAP